ncbi:Transcription factor spt8 [Rhizophlyctis rosea]|nr:Transcription factor spt8 [Rhizophlyctis rosea]
MTWEDQVMEEEEEPQMPDQAEAVYHDDAEIEGYVKEPEPPKEEKVYASAEILPQPGVDIAETYLFEPVVSAVHPCSIYCAAATRNMRWLFTGGDDGFIRKWDFAPSLNGVQMLTQNQRHGLVDSIQKGGVLLSAWENEEQSVPGDLPQSEDPSQAPAPKVSPVYSIDVQSEAVWCVTGLESGDINLWSVRHDEGHCQHVLRSHKKAVSVLRIAPGEQSLVSGSWDKRLLHWDLNTGSIVQEYEGLTSQITSACFSPSSAAANVSDGEDGAAQSAAAAPDSILMATSFDGSVCLYDVRDPVGGSVRRIDAKGLGSPPWALSACWSNDRRRIYVGRRDGSVDEIDFAEGRLLRKLKLPQNSGHVYNVSMMPNDRHLLCASYDNVRLWDLTKSSAPARKPLTPETSTPVPKDEMEIDPIKWEDDEEDGEGGVRVEKVGGGGNAGDGPVGVDDEPPEVPFAIVPGHHGGVISSLCEYFGWLLFGFDCVEMGLNAKAL